MPILCNYDVWIQYVSIEITFALCEQFHMQKNAVAFRKNCTMWRSLEGPFTPAIYYGIVIIITFKNGLCTHFGIAIAFHIPHRKNRIRSRVINRRCEQECIPVGCVPPAHWSYLCISSYPTHVIPPEQPCTPPRATMHAPQSNHAHPPNNHTHPPEQQCMPPRTTMHASLPPRSNHARAPCEQNDKHV